MHTPKVTEISALSAHRREVALVRWSLVAIPPDRREPAPGPDPLRSLDPGFLPQDRFLSNW
jgi:hypothetical protein